MQRSVLRDDRRTDETGPADDAPMGVAVIVPVYNRGATVLEALDSVTAQTCAPQRLVVVDDGSTDDTAATVSQWIESRHLSFAVALIRKPNGGVSSARNRGLHRIGNCQYIAFLDSDDIWPVDFLERASSVLAADPRAVAATADRQYIDRLSGTTRHENMSGIGRDAVRWLMTNDGGIASATLFRTSAIQARGEFDETLKTGEDMALFLPLSLDGSWKHIPGAPVCFRHGSPQGSREAGNLSAHFADNHRRWARIYEDFVRSYQGHPALPDSLCSRVVSNRWYRAGRELMRADRVLDARECFRQSTRWRLLNKAWLRVATSYLRRAA